MAQNKSSTKAGMRKNEWKIQGFLKLIRQVHEGKYQKKFCFVLGAGASRSSGIPTGQELVNRWEEDMQERNADEHEAWKKRLGITDTNKDQHYSDYYEEYFLEPEDGYNYLKGEMADAMPSAGYVVLAYLLCQTPHKVVITTNFDHLVEKAVNEYAHTIPLVIGHEAIAHHVPSQITDPVVFKIHNDLLLKPKSVKRDLKILPEEWKAPLERVFREYHPIFIGYAGNDPSLMDFLLENVELFKDRKWKQPYWMLYGEDQPTEKAERFVNGAGGLWIRHEGFDIALCQIGKEMGYVEPKDEDEEAFLKDARQRFAALRESFGKLKATLNMQSSKTDGQPTADSAVLSLDELLQPTDEMQQYRNAVRAYYEERYNDALDILKALITERPDNAHYHDSLGVTLHKMKHYEEALVEAKKAVELEPDNARYRNELGIALHVMKRYEEALVEAKKAVELEPDNARYRNELGIALHEMKRYEEAQAEKKKAVELEPDNARYRNSLGITLHEMKHYEEALVEAKKAVELEPDNASYHDSLSTTLHEMKHYEEALVEAKKAVELEPDNASYHDSLGITLHAMKRYKEAQAEKKKAVELEPDNASYHDSLGITLHKMKHYEEAQAEKKKAVELEPDNARYQCSFGITLAALERYDEALKAVLQARKLAPDDDYPYYGLGIVLRGQKRYDEALEASQKAVELKSEVAYRHWRLAQILHDMERNNEALSAIQKAAELDPSDQDIQETLQAIQTALDNQ